MSGGSWTSPLRPSFFFLLQLPDRTMKTVLVITMVILLEMVASSVLIDGCIDTHIYTVAASGP